MYRTSNAIGTTITAALFAAAIAAGAPLTSQALADACLSTDKIDGSDAGHAVKVMEAAGYMQPHGLKKGCDNYWYAQATKEGATVDVVLPPAGQPFTAHNS